MELAIEEHLWGPFGGHGLADGVGAGRPLNRELAGGRVKDERVQRGRQEGTILQHFES
jgi:hypothetical protein